MFIWIQNLKCKLQINCKISKDDKIISTLNNNLAKLAIPSLDFSSFSDAHKSDENLNKKDEKKYPNFF